MNQFQNTNIQVASIEAKMASTGNMKYILTATDKKKYYFFQKVKGADSDVFQVFNNMGVKQGSIINIGFTEEEKSFVGKDGKNINYTDRYIGSMREADGIPSVVPQKAPVKSNLSEPAYVSEPKTQEFWDERGRRLALHGFINARLVNNPISQVEQEIDQLLKLEDKINSKLLPSTPQAPVVYDVNESDVPLPEIPF